MMPALVMDSLGFAREVPSSAAGKLAGHCPACGKGKIFRAYLKVSDECPTCGEELHHHRADDAPPYLTIVVVGHIVGTLLLVTEERYGCTLRYGQPRRSSYLFGFCRS